VSCMRMQRNRPLAVARQDFLGGRQIGDPGALGLRRLDFLLPGGISLRVRR